ncbi:MAG TPA: class I SAM-dependent methyltransferase [Agriterribacter sp.]|nr:class I SAM-dependent methyltransferase [Chitinophagaceae bacterium]HRP31656.1 class I SAM-dependent methyltransferase [Agriterribacter sp.]
MKKIVWKLKVWSGKAFRMLLYWIYGFDQWHLFTLTERNYARDIIAYCNSRSIRNSFAEIGCGLGDILRNVKFTQRLGLDNDKNVLAAAAFLNKLYFKKNIRLGVFYFPESDFEGSYNVIVMVNWIHHVEPLTLKKKIEEYFEWFLQDGGVIIIDTVQDPEYEFNHNISFLTENVNCELVKIGDYERNREVWSIIKVKSK